MTLFVSLDPPEIVLDWKNEPINYGEEFDLHCAFDANPYDQAIIEW